MSQKEIIINGRKNLYNGLPLQVGTENDAGWGGRTNFLRNPIDNITIPELNDLEHGFLYVKRFAAECDYGGGYLLDFEAGIVYYDNAAARAHVEGTLIPHYGWAGHFTQFIPTDFGRRAPVIG